MRRILTTFALALVLTAGAARADNDCRVPAADWQPREAVLALAKDDGFGNSFIQFGDGLDILYFIGVTAGQLQAGDFTV